MTGNWLGHVALAAYRSTGPGSPIGRLAARHLARAELAKLARLPLWERILADIGHLFNAGGSAVPAGWFGLIVIAVLAAALVLVILTWVRPARRRRIKTSAALGGHGRTAQEYRREAERLAAAGSYGEAIVEGVRAIAAELEERGVLTPRLGRTANELAIEAGSELAEMAVGLRAVTGLFDDVRYGDRAGTADGYQQVRQVDVMARTAHAAAGGTPRLVASGLGVPR